jgi:signal transduction histidine kinase
MPRETWRRAGRVAVWSVGLAAGAAVLVLGLTDARTQNMRVAAVLSAVFGWTFMASGLVAARRRPDNRLGPLMIGLGVLWLTAQLIGFSHTSAVLATAGAFLGDGYVIPLALLFISFPSGRLRSRRDLLLVAPFVIALVPLELAWMLFFAAPPPGNALEVWDKPGVADAIDWAQRIILAGASLALAAFLAHRWRTASAPLRRRLTPVLAGAGVLLVSTGNFLVAKITDRPPPEWLQIAVLAALIAVPIAVLADILRARLARSAVGDLVLALRADHAPADLRPALARALGDPSLEVAFWLPEFETYADLDGRPVALPEDVRRVTRMVDGRGAPVAALVHDQWLHEDRELLDAVGAAAGIALENARLRADLLARVDELRRSRARILEAAQSERRRLERDLHDGAQQRLVTLALELGRLEARLGSDPDARDALAQARAELGLSLAELRELARGIHPAIVTGHGLAVAVESVAARAPVPVELRVELDGRLPEPVEVAAYFLVSEGLTNVAKYAHASAASVVITRANGDVVVEIADDGVGGADAASGSGLRGLTDRVEALGGCLAVESPVGGGTRMRAQIPCA